jgi:hypothetical protein
MVGVKLHMYHVNNLWWMVLQSRETADT